jgi:Tweety
MADFCMSPYDNLQVSISGDSTSTSEMVSYYSTCEGTNPLYTPVSSAQSLAGEMASFINDLLDSSCVNNSYLIQAQGNITAIQSCLNNIEQSYACPPIELEFNQILTNGLCEDGFTGLYILWLWIYVTSSLAVVSTVIVSVIHMYFARYWNIDEDDHHSSVFDEEEYGSYSGHDKVGINMVVNPATVITTSRHSSMRRNSQRVNEYDDMSLDHI